MLPVANPKVIYKALSEGAVLLSTTDEVYFGLNEVGARVWEHLPPVLDTLDELCAEIGSAYPDTDPATIRADVSELLTELVQYGLVIPRETHEERRVGNGSAQAGQTQSH